MGDNLTPEQRRATMRRVRSKDTGPEMKVRRLAHALGYRFRLHRRDLPGNPDMVFPRLHKVIFIHGCFWHGHKGCKAAKTPATNLEYWLPKLQRTKERDVRNIGLLQAAEWAVLVIWECQTSDAGQLRSIVVGFLEEKANG